LQERITRLEDENAALREEQQLLEDEQQRLEAERERRRGENGGCGGGRWPDHGADPALAVASTLSSRLLGHTPQRGTASYLGLLSS
jgi:hypothetical protein